MGQLRDGSIVLVTVDGRQPGLSVGLTNFELAQTLARLGAVNAMSLDGGGSTTMAYDGRVLNTPSDGTERRIATGLVFAYRGVFAPDVPARISPNADGVDDTASLSYRVLLPSTVTAKLVAPDGTVASRGERASRSRARTPSRSRRPVRQAQRGRREQPGRRAQAGARGASVGRR